MAPRQRTRRRWRLVRAGRDAVPASLRRLTHPARGPRADARPGAARWWMLASALIVLAAAGGWLALATSVLGVRQVEVTGAHIAGADRVRSAAAVPLGMPLARVDTGAVGARVRALPSVADVVVRRSWPGTLVLEVTERVPVAVVARDGAYLVLDRDGVVFHAVPRRPDGVVLLVVDSPGPADPATRAALRVVAVLTEPLRDRLRVLVAASAYRVRLELTGGVSVVWGDADRGEIKARVATALLAEGRGKTIDVSAPDVATVR